MAQGRDHPSEQTGDVSAAGVDTLDPNVVRASRETPTRRTGLGEFPIGPATAQSLNVVDLGIDASR
jgi:hypothetical protein